MSDEKQETITDIITEKRRRAAEWEKTLGDQHSSVESLKDDADRLEAALKRERGDCAKLREALEVARNCDVGRGVLSAALEYVNKVYDILSRPCVCLEEARQGCREARVVLIPALAAPPRNCDKYPHDQALRIWSAEPENPMNGCFAVWLYAPATEQEGGAK